MQDRAIAEPVPLFEDRHSRPDKNLLSVTAETDENGDYDSRKFAVQPGDFMDGTRVKEIEIARLQANFKVLDLIGRSVFVKRSLLNMWINLGVPEALVNYRLSRSVATLCILQDQYSGKLVFKFTYRVIVSFLSQADRVEVRFVSVAIVVGANNCGAVLAAVRLISCYSTLAT